MNNLGQQKLLTETIHLINPTFYQILKQKDQSLNNQQWSKNSKFSIRRSSLNN